MSPIDWLERLKLYLAPLRRQEIVDCWDDSRIRPGADWRAEIQSALGSASAAILLVGPGFLASDFIDNVELPSLLSAAATRGAKVYPVVVGYCAYQLSPLERYEAFNDPAMPLEALAAAEQNRLLNEIATAVDRDLREARQATRPNEPRQGIGAALKEIKKHLGTTWSAFLAQCRKRNDLVAAISRRLHLVETTEYEIFFFRYYAKLTDEERFQFQQIRAITEGPLYKGNQAILDLIERHPAVLDAAPLLEDLRQHLVFWLNKYEHVFVNRPEMCLLYTGVEDGVPFPSRVQEQVDAALKAGEGTGSRSSS